MLAYDDASAGVAPSYDITMTWDGAVPTGRRSQAARDMLPDHMLAYDDASLGDAVI
jgi:hypothetical protein